MKAVLATSILVSLCYLTFRYRDRIAAWWPGIKTNVWHAVVGFSGVLAALLDELKLFNWQAMLTPENAAFATLSVAVIGILLRQVTGGRDA